MGVQKLSAARMIEELESSASINERDLISYLDVADKTLRNWRTSKSADVSGKALRLRRLKEVVDAALSSSLSKPLIRQLLVAPLDTKDREQKSIIDLIKSQPEFEFFPQVISMLVENFRIRQSTNGHFVLSNADFDKLIEDLQGNREPSDAVKRARERFAQLRKENSK